MKKRARFVSKTNTMTIPTFGEKGQIVVRNAHTHAHAHTSTHTRARTRTYFRYNTMIIIIYAHEFCDGNLKFRGTYRTITHAYMTSV